MAISYSASSMDLGKARATGKATCEGGAHPSPPLHNYPLLAWTHLGHEKHGSDVFTEDQKASVTDVAQALAKTPSIEALAAHFGTTEAHITQALDYALEAGVIAEKG